MTLQLHWMSEAWHSWPHGGCCDMEAASSTLVAFQKTSTTRGGFGGWVVSSHPLDGMANTFWGLLGLQHHGVSIR